MKFVKLSLTEAQLELIIDAMNGVDIHQDNFTIEQYMHYATTIDKLDRALDYFKEAGDDLN